MRRFFHPARVTSSHPGPGRDAPEAEEPQRSASGPAKRRAGLRVYGLEAPRKRGDFGRGRKSLTEKSSREHVPGTIPSREERGGSADRRAGGHSEKAHRAITARDFYGEPGSFRRTRRPTWRIPASNASFGRGTPKPYGKPSPRAPIGEMCDLPSRQARQDQAKQLRQE